MEQTHETSVVGVRFSKVGKIYHFSADTVSDIKVGDMVVVETSRGWQLGQVAQVIENAQPPPEGWKPVDRRATPRDLLLRQMWQMKEAEVVSTCKNKAADLRLVGIKIVSAEYSFDGSRLMILFNSETEEKYDLKSLRSDMQKMYGPSQVEMRQIGPRDVAKVVCGMGACGLETRCCCLFLTEFSSISIRMAKEQGISLTPSEITGMCGRLRCCLIYEYDTYVDSRSKLPKRNKRVRTPQGEGKVVDVVPLREAVIVDLPEVGHREFPSAEVTLIEDGAAGQPQQPAAQKEAPFVGSQQPSEIDQAIVREEEPREFTISGDSPRTPADKEPTGSSPAHEGQSGSDKPSRAPGERGGRRGQGGPGGAKGQPQTPQAGRGPGGRGPRREGRQRPETGVGGRPEGGTPPASTGPETGTGPRPERHKNRPGGRPNRPKGEGRGGPSRGGQPGSGQPGGTGPAGGEQPNDEGSKNYRDSRRRKGQRRDSNDSENRA